MLVEPIDLPDLIWGRGAQARLWYIQPPLVLAGPPFQPQHQPENPTGLQLLAATIEEAGATPPPSDAPTIIMLPECSIRPDEIAAARALIRGARTNTLVVFGASQLDELSARALEPGGDLWDGPAAGHFTNVAIIALGGSDRLYLQPKIIRSRHEQDTHWRGRVVRYFRGRHVQFVVVICSELLDRPDGATTVHSVVNEIHANGGRLNLAIWLQHTSNPRSPEFVDSIAEFQVFRTTLLVVSSACDRRTRMNNYGVSGAIIPHDALPRDFSLLTRRFHYAEPIPSPQLASRMVLLRYDAHVHRVDTVLAESIQPDDHAARGAVFEESQPFMLRGATLSLSNDHVHLEDLTLRAAQIALARSPAPLHEPIRGIRSRLVEQTTTHFSSFLDVGIAPRPRDEASLHPAGMQHPGGDLACRCWEHRECIDKLADDDTAAQPLSVLIEALAAMEMAGLDPRPMYDKDRRTNTCFNIKGQQVSVGLVYPFDLNAEGTERALWGSRSARVVDSPYIVLGTGGRLRRRPLAQIDPSRAALPGPVRAGISAVPTLRAVYSDDFWTAVEQGTLPTMLAGLVGVCSRGGD